MIIVEFNSWSSSTKILQGKVNFSYGTLDDFPSQ